jgi:hypothetical protein
MIATADSRTNRRICAVINIPIRDCLIVGPLFPRSVNKRCLAIISKSISKSGKGGGRGALFCKGSVLKGIILNKL